MEFVTVRDLRIRSAEIWEKLREQGELVLTNNGKPITILSGVEQNSVEEVLGMVRRARAGCRLAAASGGGADRR